MPSLADHHSSSLIKLLLLGDAKSGKTTALASLVAAGYRLRILDFDNLLDPLVGRLKALNPELLANVEYRSLRDRYKGTPAGVVIDGKPRAWIESLKMLNRWQYDDMDLGSPASWGPNCILVIDSLSRWCDAAYDFHADAAGSRSDGRMIYGNAQDDVEKQLAGLTSPSFETNVIVICHGVYMDQPDKTTKIFPQGVGQKLSPKIPQYFPNYIRITKSGERRRLQLRSDPMIDLANTRPDLLTADLDPDTGLAEFFAALKGQPVKSQAASAAARPTTVTLKRV